MAKYKTTTAAALGLLKMIESRVNKGEGINVPTSVIREHISLHRVHWINLSPGHDWFSKVTNSGWTSILLISGAQKDYTAELNIAESPKFYRSRLA